MKKKTYLGKAIALFAVVAVVIALVVSCSQPTNSGGGGAISGGSDTTGGNGTTGGSGTTGGKNAQITINLPPIGSTAIRSLTDAQVSRLQRETAKYRVIFSGLGQTIPRDGDGTTFSAVFPVGAQVSVTVYCLNKNDEVIVKTVTKTVTISSGTNSLSFKLSEDGEEIIPERDDGGSGGDEKPDDTDKEPEEDEDGGDDDDTEGGDTPSGGDSGNNPPIQPSTPKFAVSYELDRGDWNPQLVTPTTEQYEAGTQVTITANVPSRQGYTFAGWKASGSLMPAVGGNFRADDTFTMPQAAVTLTAQWDINYKTNKADWEVGDIVLQDTFGSIVAIHKDAYAIRDTAYGEGVAVVYKNDAAGQKVYIVGKVHEKNKLAWCLQSVAGYFSTDAALVTEMDDETNGQLKFKTGTYTDGSTGFAALQAIAANDYSETNYPAWYWANTYGTKQGLTGDLSTDWYLPTLAELFDIWKAKVSVEATLGTIGGNDFSGVGSFYWSSSHSASAPGSALKLYFVDGSLGGDSKSATNAVSVCAVRQLQY